MLPNIIIFDKTITWYAITALIGIFVSLGFAYFKAKRIGLDAVTMLFVMLFGFFGAVIGGHLLYGITMFDLIIKLFSDLSVIRDFNTFINYMYVIFGGSVFYGGFIGAIIFSFIYLYIKKPEKLNEYISIGVLCIPLFHAFGRLGCFLSGCCYGIECDFGVIYKYSLVLGANGPTRFPVQLVECVLNICIFLALYFMCEKGKLSGINTLFSYIGFYAPIRFALEFLRGDAYRGFLFGFSTSQIISLLLMIAVLVYLIVFNIKHLKRRSNIKS